MKKGVLLTIVVVLVLLTLGFNQLRTLATNGISKGSHPKPSTNELPNGLSRADGSKALDNMHLRALEAAVSRINKKIEELEFTRLEDQSDSTRMFPVVPELRTMYQVPNDLSEIKVVVKSRVFRQPSTAEVEEIQQVVSDELSKVDLLTSAEGNKIEEAIKRKYLNYNNKAHKIVCGHFYTDQIGVTHKWYVLFNTDKVMEREASEGVTLTPENPNETERGRWNEKADRYRYIFENR